MVNNPLSKLVNDAGSISWRPSMARYMVCPCSSAFSVEASFFLGVSERTVERYISNFLVTGDVKSEIIGRSYEETRNVFRLKKAWASFVFGVKNPQTNVYSWCIHFHARWTLLMKFWVSNSVTTVPFGSANSVRHSPLAILSDNLYWNSSIFPIFGWPRVEFLAQNFLLL